MRITIWHFDHYPTSPGVYLGHFPKLGHQVTWITSHVGSSNHIECREEGSIRYIEVYRKSDSKLPRPFSVIANRWNKLLTFVNKLRVLSGVSKDKPDLLQVRELVTEGILGFMFARRSGIPFAFQYDYPHFEARLFELDTAGKSSPLRRWKLRRWIDARNWVLRHADIVLPISDHMADILHSRLSIPKERIIVFPVGASEKIYDAGEAARGPNRESAELRIPTVCYMGNLEPIREPHRIFELMEHVLECIPEARLLLIGKLNPVAKSLIDKYSKPQQIQITGFIPREEIPHEMQRAQVGIFPLPTDDPYRVFLTSSPLKVVEYMSAGLPVVSSRISEAIKLIEESHGGTCVDNDPACFGDAVIHYLRNPEEARSVGQAGREYIGKKRLFGVMAADLEVQYQNILESS